MCCRLVEECGADDVQDLSAHFFFNALKGVSNWPSLAIGVAAQKVQV